MESDIILDPSDDLKQFCHECSSSRGGWNRHQCGPRHRCHVIVQAVQALFARYKLSAKDDWDGAILVDIGSKVLQIGVWCYGLRTGVSEIGITYEEVDNKSTIPTNWIRTLRDTHSKSNLQIAREALQNCSNNHDCQFRGAFLPKRLVDVQGTGADEDTLSVVVSANTLSSETVRYVALSYCWGGKTPSKDTMLNNTKEDLAAMEHSLRLPQLPVTYQDAIKTTRYLGIRYLWIDALCIAQGDAEEWTTESLKMAETYSHAFVTISADASLTCDDSFLDTQRYRELSAGIEVPCCEVSGVRSPVLARISPGSLYGNCDKTGFPPRASMMVTRGWTFQEGLLNRRVLSFRHTHVHFRCMEGAGTEDTLLKYGLHDDVKSGLTFGNESSWRMMLGLPATTHLTTDEVETVWRQIIHDYTPRYLTKADDRLVAVAGVASVLRDRTAAGNFYWTGLWKDLFVQLLLWVRGDTHDRGQEQRTPSQHLKFPSWSWASITAPIKNLGSCGHIYYTKLLQDPCIGDDFDGTRSGPAVVEGPCVDAVGSFKLEALAPVGLGYSVETRFEIYLDTPLEITPLPGKAGVTLQRGRSVEGYSRYATQAHVHLLLVCVDRWSMAYFLVLTKRMEDEEQYARIGLWRTPIAADRRYNYFSNPDEIPQDFIEDMPIRRIPLI